MPPLPMPVQAKWRQLLQIFRNESDIPYGDLLTPTQLQIIDTIAKRGCPRTQLILPTQYGKSLSVALGVLLRVANHKEKWAIVAPTEEKARIIMDYIIEHIFDDPVFEERLEFHESKEKLKQHRSKSRISFRDAGEVRVYSADAGNSKKVKSALLGYGAPNIILDEAGQISDELYATVKRMTGGSEGTEGGTFLLEIGNPVFRNHFHSTWYGDLYQKIYVNDEMALAEGRYTREYLDEMSELPGYDWMFRCLFPDAEEVLASGYRRLVSDLVIDDAMVDADPHWIYRRDRETNEILLNEWGHQIVNDEPILGVDVAGGGANLTKFVVRWPKHNFAKVVATSNSDDLDEIADIVEGLIRQYNIGDYRVVVDAGGVGHGLPAIMKSRNYLIKGVLFGQAVDDKAFTNLRAYMYWTARKWLKKEKGQLLRDIGFQEMKLIYYKQNTSLRLQIEPKDEMIKRKSNEGDKVQSPDTADAFVLTFVDTRSIVDEDDIFID
jgi:hypothetical protein